MARRYQQEELLFLRQSPLCVKPKDLPPVEEWIGQTIDERTKRTALKGELYGEGPRSRREGQIPGNGATTSRPLTSESSDRQHGRRTSNGELSLKGMFPPTIRDGTKTYDSSTRPGFGPLSPRGEQPAGMGRFGLGDREQPQSRENRGATRFSALRTSKDEGESWLGGKKIHKQGGEDGERGFGRRGDRERDQDATRENGREHRRYGSEAATENIRNRDWRAADRAAVRGPSKDWNNGLEEDPEWMAEEKPAADEKKHTVEDFEAWKKSMKAQSAAAKGEPEPALDLQGLLSQVPPPKKTIETPLAVDAAEDKFFGLWGAPQAKDASFQPAGQTAQQAPTLKGGKSKFTNFFAAPEPQQIPQIQQPPIEQAAPTPPQSGPGFKAPANSKDEEGFQRILNMLKAKSPAAPQSNTAFQAPPRHRTPPLEATSTSATPPLVSPRPKPHGVQNFLNPQSPAGNPDSQFLLNLMKSKDPEPQQSSFAQQYGSPVGQPSSYNQHRQPHPPSHVNQPFDRNLEERFHNDFPPAMDKLNPSAHLHNQTRHSRMDSRGFDDLPLHQQQQHGPPFGMPPGYHPGMNGPNFPPGLGPMPGQSQGFDPRDPRGPRGPLGAPPGFGGPAPPFRGMDYPPGFPMPNIAGLNMRDDHGPGPGAGVPPGFGGPIGGMTRPPPGFPGRGGGMQFPDYDGRRDEQRLYGGRD